MIGTDLVDKNRIAAIWEKNGLAFAHKILHPKEQLELKKLTHKQNIIRFLAMRWAAKEAFAKAMGTGLRPPILMPHFYVKKDTLGAPSFGFSPEIEDLLQKKSIINVYLSLTDEKHLAHAMVMLQKN